MWYFWCGLLFFMFLLSMCACLWKLRSRSALLTGGYPYTPLGQEATYVQTCTPTAPSMMTGGSHAFADLHGNPPPYSRPDPSQHKSSSPPPAYAQVVAHRDIYDD
ncbi:hypothetical protein V1264_014209 [Littorina saxatilis]|uniref:Vesicular, overexpressed in cancer, prosurvival protein 1 n=2 Tax=Littorina saxatilis TaxID=31220 RepID=A0AAN9GKS4_9CAEN